MYPKLVPHELTLPKARELQNSEVQLNGYRNSKGLAEERVKRLLQGPGVLLGFADFPALFDIKINALDIAALYDMDTKDYYSERRFLALDLSDKLSICKSRHI